MILDDISSYHGWFGLLKNSTEGSASRLSPKRMRREVSLVVNVWPSERKERKLTP